ncbi:MAG TPA: c-type cytochrome [Methylomirabilota bacterium]|nr:c-type cytochrome [Methylomirabilota bacterium]
MAARMLLSHAARRGGLVLGIVLPLALAAPATSTPAQGTPWVAPASEKAKKNPTPADKKTVERGEKVAKVNCVSCHGSKGKGDGAAAVALNPKPADWTSKKVQDEADGELFWKITTGRGAMPSWRHLPEADRWALVRYIRTLAAK